MDQRTESGNHGALPPVPPAWPPLLLNLWWEHRRIETLLDALESLVEALERQPTAADLGEAIRLQRELVEVEAAHDRHEETALFPLLQPALAGGGERHLVAALEEEHRRTQALLVEIAGALAQGEPGLAAWGIRRYLRQVRDHLGAEDAVVFPLAVERLPVTVLSDLPAGGAQVSLGGG